MSSARRPEHGESTPLRVPPFTGGVPALGPMAAEWLLAPPLSARPPHLVPCARCAAFNGRSALVCWSCEADLLAAAPFAPAAPAGPPVDPAVEPEPTGVGRADAAEGRRGLRLVATAVTPTLAPAPAAAVAVAPADTADLPVLTALVEDAALAPRWHKTQHRQRPLIALSLVALALLAAAAGLRWSAPAPVASPRPAPTAAPADAAPERPFEPPGESSAPDRASLSFEPVEVAPAAASVDRPARAARGRPAPPARAVSATPRPAGPPRENREMISPPPPPCTSNMAALGFCTLQPASPKE